MLKEKSLREAYKSGKRNSKGRLHCEDGPTITTDRYEIWYKNGKIHRDGDKPAFIQRYYNGNVKHKWYFKHGKKHRDGDKPAFIQYSFGGKMSLKRFYKNDKEHRDNDQPSTISAKQKIWKQHGVLHRVSGPAVLSEGVVYIKRYYVQNGKYHRINGPAYYSKYKPFNIISKFWYVDGIDVTDEVKAFREINKMKTPLSKADQLLLRLYLNK